MISLLIMLYTFIYTFLYQVIHAELCRVNLMGDSGDFFCLFFTISEFHLIHRFPVKSNFYLDAIPFLLNYDNYKAKNLAKLKERLLYIGLKNADFLETK